MRTISLICLAGIKFPRCSDNRVCTVHAKEFSMLALVGNTSEKVCIYANKENVTTVFHVIRRIDAGKIDSSNPM